MTRSASGVEINAAWQYWDERPNKTAANPDGETVYATEPEPAGSEQAENVPVPDPVADTRPAREGQTTLADWGGDSA